MSFPTGWNYRCPITIASGTVSESLMDWPLLLTEANIPAEIFTAANADGSDIRASNDEAGTTELAVEVVSFTPGSSTAQVWVKVPSVSAVADTTIYLWFGNAAATMPAVGDAFGRNAVWSNNFSAVWHLEESGNGTLGEYVDSSGNGVGGQAGSGNPDPVYWPVQSTGQIGNSQYFDGNADIKCATPGGTISGAFTVELWLKASGTGTGQWFSTRSTGEKSIDIQKSAGGLHGDIGNGAAWLSTAADYTIPGGWDGAFHHVAYAVSSTGVQIYWDGAPVASKSWGESSPLLWDATGTRSPYLGAFAFNSSGVTGYIGESRAVSATVSAAWIAADYASQSSPGTFATAGSVTTILETTIKVHFALSGGTVKVLFTQ